jgi:hypothetical protein
MDAQIVGDGLGVDLSGRHLLPIRERLPPAEELGLAWAVVAGSVSAIVRPPATHAGNSRITHWW